MHAYHARTSHCTTQHTSFLWDFDEELFEKYLTLPAKRPDYRASRSHTDFLCRLKYFFRNHETEEDHTLQRTSTASQDYDVFSSPYAEHPFASSVIERLQDTFQKVERCSILEAAKSMDGKYHKSTRVLNVEDYQQ